ncbi:hypothetical protein [Nocardioides soli]|uniref:Uncharacterized protein n=1 Tax=Nocardioides soli TaxID=1036020 RepID=A0A7W4VRH1_9ACTN|nr:hypothetical protein [Nocardioides soli]MBB3040374.1 hypothetical protein [Nocardioides soli]
MRSGVLAGMAVLMAWAGTVVSVPVASADPAPGVSVAPMPVLAVPLAQAGQVHVWGADPYHQWGPSDNVVLPESLNGVAVSQVALGTSVGLAVTAAGKVVGWGNNVPARLEKIPPEIEAADVVQVAVGPTGASYAGAVTRDGRVLTWGLKRKFTTPLDVPAGLTGVVQLAIPDLNAVALKADGSVVAWGTVPSLNDVPAQLQAPGSVRAIATGQSQAWALTTQGTIVAWGQPDPLHPLPSQVLIPGNVKAIAPFGDSGGMAILADDTLVAWGRSTGAGQIPASVFAATPVSIASNDNFMAMMDTDGVLHHWTPGFPYQTNVELSVPAGLHGPAIAQFGVSNDSVGAVVVTKMLPAVAPSIAGGATVGGTLTGTPGTFSASPTSVTGQWLADGAAIPGATGATLSLTAGMVGKKITYQSTASKPGESTVSSTSTAVTVAPASDNNPLAPAKVRSKTKVSKVTAAKKGAKVTVTGKVTASKSPAGKAKVMIKKGKKTILAKTTKVTTKGAVKLTVKKFAQLVAKKTKAKGKKARTAYRGKYIVTITYTGNTQVNPSTAAKKFTIKK